MDESRTKVADDRSIKAMQNLGVAAFTNYYSLREELSPLTKPDDVHEADPDDLRREILSEPALLCIVRERTLVVGGADGRRERVLCLSPFEKRSAGGGDTGDKWTPLHKLQERLNLDLLAYFLEELKLLGGLCCGNNSLTLQTVRALYPFPLCIEIVVSEGAPTNLRAAVCILMRKL